jgi:uncharacterized Tic20 family protein
MTDEPSPIPPSQSSPPGGTPPDLPSTAEERSTGLLLHLSQFLGLAMPLLGLVAPLIIWQTKREQSKYLDWHGKEAVNFQITAFIAWCIAALLTVLTCGFGAFLFGGLFAAIVVCVILAAMRANEGKCWRYPMTIRLVK